jgi:hypothetical protein
MTRAVLEAISAMKAIKYDLRKGFFVSSKIAETMLLELDCQALSELPLFAKQNSEVARSVGHAIDCERVRYLRNAWSS